MLGHFLRSTLFLFLLAPLYALAVSVEIVDIQYNPAGSDKGREYIRIHNVSGMPLDLTNWRLFEGGVNHKIKAMDTAIIPVGGYAIIAENATQYFADHINTPDVLFDSVFSLSNSGETIALKDGTGAVVVHRSYVATPKQDTRALTAATIEATPRATKSATRTLKKPSQAAAPQFVDSAAALPPSGTGGMWPWLLGLGGLIVVGIGGVVVMTRTSKSGYTVVDISDHPK